MTSISRRAFLASCTGVALARAADSPLRIVDTHTHFYDPSRPQGVPWPKEEDKILYRKVLPAEYRALAQPQGIAGTVVIEASPWLEDNQWLLDLAERERFIVGVVGNLDPLDGHFAANLARFAKNPLFRGLRVSGQTLIDHGREPAFLEAMRRIADASLSLDINNGPFLPHVPALAHAARGLRIVIDHIGGAGDPAKLPSGWQEDMRRASEEPNVFCKVSGMPEQTGFPKGEAPKEPGFYRPILDAVWTAFGEDRVIFGSNWPVSNNGTDFASVLRIVREFFAEKGADATVKYFRENGRKVYRWVER